MTDEKKALYSLVDLWDDESLGINSLTVQGIRNLLTLMRKHGPDEISLAIKLTWEASQVSNEGKFRYMCGILKNRAKDEAERCELLFNQEAHEEGK